MQQGFAEAALNKEHHVFGYRMQPLSASHLMVLEAVDSPIVDSGKVEISDLLFAAKLCANPVELICGSWSVKIPSPSLGDSIRHLIASRNPAYFNRQAVAWASYWLDYLTTPEKLEAVDSGASPVSSPSVFACVVRAIPKLGEQRAWSMPYGLLRTYVDVEDELAGAAIKFAPDDREQAEILAGFDEADRAGLEILRQIEEEEASWQT